MLKENLVMLRSINGFSQEQVAEKINISRQAYAKWETGATVPDIEKCSLLADMYGITIDSLIKTEKLDSMGMVPPAPKGKHIWGSIIMNDRGQIVIPKGARDQLGLIGGTRLVVLSDEEGIALVAAEKFESHMRQMMELAAAENENCS